MKLCEYCGNSKTQTSFYYRNVRHKINIRVDLIENDALKVISSIVKKDSRLQEAIKKYGVDVADHVQFLGGQLTKLKEESAHLQSDKKQYIENLSLLLKSCSNPDEIRTVKDGFKDHLDKFGNNAAELDAKISNLAKELETAKCHHFSWDNVAEQAEKILGTIAENDPLAIKTAYHALFNSVIVGPENDQGIRTIRYILSEESHEDIVGPRFDMVEAAVAETNQSDIFNSYRDLGN